MAYPDVQAGARESLESLVVKRCVLTPTPLEPKMNSWVYVPVEQSVSANVFDFSPYAANTFSHAFVPVHSRVVD